MNEQFRREEARVREKMMMMKKEKRWGMEPPFKGIEKKKVVYPKGVWCMVCE
jgi:hypothetical protein